MRRCMAATFAAMLLFLLPSCGSENSKTVDIQQLADELAEKIQYEDTMTAMSQEKIGHYFTLPENSTVIGYMSSGTTAEEIIVGECADDAGAAALHDTLGAFLNEQKDAFKNYMPEEVERLEHSVLRQSGRYVALCVTADMDTANSVIDTYLK